ncbi:NS1 [Tetraparvovirus sp.]|uniref:NS1 n=1 Tax=Tetraparvovirus sp. TaxID=1908804 RepID=UPI0008A99049|nr:NS1 [Tetraparvovirus sp.]AOW44155.1 NS1 [Tetraparvovirus sp.]
MDAPAFTAVLQVPTTVCEGLNVQFRSTEDLHREVPDEYPDWPVTDLRASGSYFDLSVNLGRLMYRELVESFHMILPMYMLPGMYIQVEPSVSDGREFHYHLVCEQGSMSGRDFSTWLKRWKVFMDRYLLEGHTWALTWQIRKTRQGRLYQADLSFVQRYLLPKLPVEHCWFAWTNIERFKGIILSVPNRVRCGTEGGAIPLPYITELTAATASETVEAPAMAGKGTDRFLSLIDWLVDQGIATERKWLAADKRSYRSFLGSSGGVLQARNALAVAKREMVLAHPLLGYLQRGGQAMASDNKVAELFKLNGYDPSDAAWYFAGWAQGVWAKRRALWLWGPASTGKTLLAAAIANLSPSYGCVNWTNQNFPFNDCHCQSLVWWEEGRMTENIVEVAKAILGGAPVRLDVKNKGSEDFIPTCVIITSNGDLTVTIDGPVISSAHQEALKTRITMFRFQRLVPPGLAPIPDGDLRDFFRTGFDLLTTKGAPPEAFQVPRPCEKPMDPPECISPLRLLASVSETREHWSSEDEWFPPLRQSTPAEESRDQTPPNTPEAASPNPPVDEIVSQPFPTSPTSHRYRVTSEAAEVELWWLNKLRDEDWADHLNLRGPEKPVCAGLFYYHLWLSEPWRYRRRLALTEASHQRSFYDWNWW